MIKLGLICLLFAAVCTAENAEIAGGWSGWTDYTPCDRTCGNGMKFRERRCENPAPKNGGRFCSGALSEVRACKERSCSCYNFKFFKRGACSASSAKSIYTRVRGKCDGWPRLSLTECLLLCHKNKAPNGCSSKPCKYVIYDRNPDFLPGWCQLATDECELEESKTGAEIWKAHC